MTKHEARLALRQRQRRFEWSFAREEHARAAARLVAGKAHGLRNTIHIIQLASEELEQQCAPAVRPYLDDLRRAAGEAQQALAELGDAARPPETPAGGAPVGDALAAALEVLRDAFDLGLVDVRLAAPAAAAARCSPAELEHLLLGLLLDLPDAPPGAAPARLVVREREIEGAPWLEIVRDTSAAAPGGERFELAVVEAIARRAGGALTSSPRTGGGEELVVALPEVA